MPIASIGRGRGRGAGANVSARPRHPEPALPLIGRGVLLVRVRVLAGPRHRPREVGIGTATVISEKGAPVSMGGGRGEGRASKDYEPAQGRDEHSGQSHVGCRMQWLSPGCIGGAPMSRRPSSRGVHCRCRPPTRLPKRTGKASCRVWTPDVRTGILRREAPHERRRLQSTAVGAGY